MFKVTKKSLEIKNNKVYPVVSVIIPCYKFKNYIEKCINSVLSQKTNFTFEIIVIDDYSNDGTREILENMSKDSRLRILFNDKNVGIFENAKKLHSLSSGKYIAYLDGDDYFTDNYKLQKQFDFLESNPDYVLHSTGYKYIDDNDNILPPIDGHLIPLKETVSIDDIIQNNFITFGRMFRNIPNLLPDWANGLEFLDWAVNFEILRHGKAKCEDWCSGMYRVNGKGMITSKSEDEINLINDIVREKLVLEYKKTKKIKYIAIIDSFVHSKEVLLKLEECIDRLVSDKIPILLVSNTVIGSDLLKKVDYFLYDKRNQLFTDGKYTGVRDVDIYKDTGIFESHELKSGLQKHGLSVLINLYNSLNYAKTLGYTHFFRFEVDDIFGEKSRQFIKTVPDLVIKQNKKALFYFNEGAFHNGVNDTEPNNISFHFMFSEIDFYLNNIPKISNESDYERYLINTKGNLDFEIAEEFVYNNLIKSDQNLILKKSGKIDMKNDFPDTVWNKIVSESNMSEKFLGCTTMIYRIHKFPEGVSSILNPYRGEQTNQIVIMSHNYRDRSISRNIEVIFNDGNISNITHYLENNGYWIYNIFDDNVEKIKVYEDGNLIFEDITKKAKNYINFK